MGLPNRGVTFFFVDVGALVLMPPADDEVSAFGDLSLGNGEAWTAAEIASCQAVRSKLVERGLPTSKVDDILVVLFTMICKGRIEKAVDKYEGFVAQILDQYNITDIYGDDTAVEEYLRSYYPVGVDAQGRQIMWITVERPFAPEEESRLVRAGCLWYIAVHADFTTLRNGMTFVLDRSRAKTEDLGDPHKNEKKLQQTWRNYPLRPQAIFLVGGSATKRLLGGAATAIVSRVASGGAGKIAGRTNLLRDIQSMAADVVPTKSRPPWYGGKDAGLSPLEWMRARLAAFPKMPLECQ